ncbi:MAG: LysM peptidoglycan-binding domain-containing protein [Burkholderiales bacterium]|jgi:LysM repeat protein|nr:MAG: LysM peptidoglycan-binding domain-containing protein [Burkholderiales bacterium]
MFALQLSLRRAVLCAGMVAAATVVAAVPAVASAQPATVRYPITEEQRQTAEQVAQLGVPLSALAANAPDTYTVKRGDTLWDISSIFLTSPWRWPELWGMNKEQIANPHLIYPGQMLRLVKSDGRARLELVESQAGDVVRLSPTVRDLGGEREAIPSIPNRVIEPFLSKPAVVSPDELEKYARIVATQDQRVYVGVGDAAYARGIADEAVERYHVFRPARPLYDPDDADRRKPIAYEAFYLGVAQMAKGGDVATLRILESKEEIGVGDRLVPFTRLPVVNYVPRRPEQPIDGRIVSIYSGLNETGTQSIVALNRGTRQGMQVGHVLALLDTGATLLDRTSSRREYIKLPDERIGHMFVFRVFDEISYALVLRVTKPVKVGDRFTQPE